MWTSTLVTSVTLILATAWILGAVCWLLWDAAKRVDTEQAKHTARTTITVLLVWASGAVLLAASVELNFMVFLPTAVIPISLGTWALLQPRMIELLSRVRLAPLIAVQFYRNAGAIFLYLYFATETLSWGFARNAGWGDVLTGMLALPVAWAVWKNIRGASVLIVVWCVIGIGDLILAPLSAQIYGAERLVDFPINTVPLFLGPPLGILLHIFVLRVWWLQRSQFGLGANTVFATPVPANRETQS